MTLSAMRGHSLDAIYLLLNCWVYWNRLKGKTKLDKNIVNPLHPTVLIW